MKGVEMRDLYTVEFMGPEGWVIEGRFQEHNDALDCLNGKCAKRFQAQPNGVVSGNFEYRLCEVGEPRIEMKFEIKHHGYGASH